MISNTELRAIEDFRASLREEDGWVTVADARTLPGCGLWLRGEARVTWGADLPCLAVAEDELGNWFVLFREPRTGRLRQAQFLGGAEVV